EPDRRRIHWELCAEQRDDALGERARERDAECAAEEREHDTLCQELLGDAAATRAERGAHRGLAGAGRAARELPVGDVGTRDEQHGGDRAEKECKAVSDWTDDRLSQIENFRARARVRCWKLLREPSLDRRQISARRIDAHASPESSDDAHAARTSG